MSEQTSNLNPKDRILVTGHRGMVGSAIHRTLSDAGYRNLLTSDRKETDLLDQSSVRRFFQNNGIDAVVIAAAKVGGIVANRDLPASFIYENLMMECNLIHEAWSAGVSKILFLGSSCIYPRDCEQPIEERYLLGGPLEPTNEPYAVAKIAGIKLCESYNRQYQTDFRSVMPTNLYGTGDNYHPEHSHVIPALLRKFHDAKESGSKEVEVWGTGRARREFLFVDDLARACVHLMHLSKQEYQGISDPRCSHINIGTGTDVSIAELAAEISCVVGFDGNIRYNENFPDGTPRKLLDINKLRSTGWTPQVELTEGLRIAYSDFLNNTNRMGYR